MSVLNLKLWATISRESGFRSGNEHAAFSGEHIVQPAYGSQQVSSTSGNVGGVSYSSLDGDAHSQGGVGNVQTSGTTQVTGYGSQQGGQITPAGENISTRTTRVCFARE